MSDIPTSGAISLNQMHTEVGGTSGTQVSMNDSDIRGLISKASGATMSFNEWYGAAANWAATVTVGYVQGEMCIKTCSYWDNYGYQAITDANYGSLSDTSVEYLSGTPTIVGIFWSGLATQLILSMSGTVANSGWTTLTIGSTSYARTDALHNQTGTYTNWTWGSTTSAATNAFGTTTSATKSVTIQ